MQIFDPLLTKKNLGVLQYLDFDTLTKKGIQNSYTLKDLNFSINDDNPQREENYLKLANLFDVKADKLIRVNQTHSSNILIIETDEDLNKSRENYDGIITNRTDIVLITGNADCTLFVIYDQEKKILANIHSGWKGTVGRIVEKTLDIFKNRYNSNFKDVIVAISPSIKACHFEVQDDVKTIFLNEFPEIPSERYILHTDGKTYIDTDYINIEIFKKYGILDENIYNAKLCSVCNKNIIHSYRGAEEEDKIKRAVFAAKIID